MATPKGGKIQEFTQAMLDRITGREQPRVAAATQSQEDLAFAGGKRPWFPSGKPIAPVAPPEVKGRARDFAPYGNLAYVPRSEQGESAISFQTLIRMASPADGGLDLLRLAIETRKDQMAAQRWSIRGRQKNDDGGADARKFEAWLQRPDGVHTFRQWMRLLLEDHFVIDAPTIYIGKSGGRPLWELIDGSTIKLLITGDDGRTPLPPLPAYQQVLVGVPAVNYTLEELGYYPYNLRPNRLYGMSRVEQVLVTVQIALERALSQREYYTSGSVPDAFMELPKNFTLEQVQQWTEWYNSEMAGQTGQRRQVRFVLEGSKYTPTKTELLKDVFDEWLARLICYCFSLSPQALVKEMNRATATTNKEAAQEEGLEPTKLWFKDVMDDLLIRCGVPELEWWWEDEEIVDPVQKATVIQMLYGGPAGSGKPILTLAEARDMAGLPPATPQQIEELQPPQPPQLVPSSNGDNGNGNGKHPPTANGNGGDPAADDLRKLAFSKAGRAGGRSLPPLPRNERQRERTLAGIESLAAKILTAQRSALVTHIHARAISAKFAKAAPTARDLLAAIENGDLGWDDAIREELRALLEQLAGERAAAAMDQVSSYVADDEYSALLDQANERAVAWAEQRAGNLITQVSDTTRDAVNEFTAAAIENGWTNDEMAEQLSDAFGFSAERAGLIATTETAAAETAGALEGYKASGVVEGKEWSANDDPCDDCADLDGTVVGLDDDFPDEGGDGPPLHPRCECLVSGIVSEEALAGAEE